MAMMRTLSGIRLLLEDTPMRCSSELEFQDAIARAFDGARVGYGRERPLGAEDRPDFLVPFRMGSEDIGTLHVPLAGLLAVEVKIQGPVSALEAQAARYAAHPSVNAVLIVSPLMRHGMVSGRIGGKPLYIVVKAAGSLL